jgi:hypothetical protein
MDGWQDVTAGEGAGTAAGQPGAEAGALLQLNFGPVVQQRLHLL